MYVVHPLNGAIHQQTQHRKSSCYFQNLFFYTLLCSFFAVFAVWLVLYKNYKPQNTMPKCILSLEYSQLVQMDSGLVLPCITTIVHLLYEQWTPNIYLLTLSCIITEFSTQMVTENGNI